MKAGLRRTLVVLLALFALFVPAATAVAGPVWWWPTPPKPAAPDCGTTIYKSSGATWVCTFADDFSGTRLDSTKWQVVTSATNGQLGGANACFVNSLNNVSVSGGSLQLTARREARPFTCSTPYGSMNTQYTSGEVTSFNHFSQTYGRFSVRARFPAATLAGLQSSLWMWPESTTLSGLTGEIDIAEEYSLASDRVIPFLHYSFDPSTVSKLTGTNVVTNTKCLISDVSAYHEYAVEWTPTAITVLYDGQTCLVDHVLALTATPFAQPFFVVLTQTLGIGTNAFDPVNTPLPATTSIDWVHVWK